MHNLITFNDELRGILYNARHVKRIWRLLYFITIKKYENYGYTKLQFVRH